MPKISMLFMRNHSPIGPAIYWTGASFFFLGISCFVWRWEFPDAGDTVLFAGIIGALLGVVLFWHGDRKGLGAARHDAELADAGEFEQEKQTAAKGSSDAQLGLALRFVQGQGVDKDFYEAAKWARLAADQKNALAQGLLGSMYEEGQGVPLDVTEAARWYHLAAKQGVSTAQSALGSLYAAGSGVERDDAESIRWYRVAASQGDAEGQYHTGRYTEIGRGTPENIAEAIKWYGIAAEQGHAAAQASLFRLTASKMEKAKRTLLSGVGNALLSMKWILRILFWFSIAGGVFHFLPRMG